MNILITSAGQRVSLVRAFQNEIKKKRAGGKVYTVDMNPNLAPACIVSDGSKKVTSVLDSNYITNLISICKTWNVSIVVPTIDTELLVLAQNKALFASNGIKVIVSDLEFIKICRNKNNTNIFFDSKGIEVPLPVKKDKPTFPLFIKPYDGSLSKDIYLINSKEELTEYHLTNEKLMFMEYIDPEIYDEYTIDAYYDKSHLLKCAVPRKRIAVRSGEISKGVTLKNYLVDFLFKKLSKIDGAIGCLTIQVFFNKDIQRVVGIEINPRFGGGYPLSYLAGANYPKWILEEHLFDEEIKDNTDWEENLLMLRYDDEVLIHNYEE
jgi:carbamoyl-phosphate synthase large subunit